jgi:hypothetical protein
MAAFLNFLWDQLNNPILPGKTCFLTDLRLLLLTIPAKAGIQTPFYTILPSPSRERLGEGDSMEGFLALSLRVMYHVYKPNMQYKYANYAI